MKLTKIQLRLAGLMFVLNAQVLLIVGTSKFTQVSTKVLFTN